MSWLEIIWKTILNIMKILDNIYVIETKLI